MLEISCAFATSMSTPAHVEVAEELGYRRAWLYDSPALYPDVWMVLAECARRTSSIGLGPGVVVPSLRHPMVTAAAISTLCALAPDRVNVAVGSGFTGRLALGQKPLRWAFVREYVLTVQRLLAGETVEWEGAPTRMLQPVGFGPARPISGPDHPRDGRTEGRSSRARGGRRHLRHRTVSGLRPVLGARRRDRPRR